MVSSDVHVKIYSVNGTQSATLNDPSTEKRYVTAVTVTDGVNVQPQGTVTLPARNPSNNQPHKDFIRPGDLCVVEFLANTPERKGWFTALHGPIKTVSERTVISDNGSESVCVLTVESMLSVLAADATAIWMYYGTAKGIDYARSTLTVDEMNTRPFEIAFNWLTKAAMDGETYNPALPLSGYMHLDFGGLEANAVGTYKLSLVEGSHLEIVSQFLDAPMHELYATVGTASEFQGTKTQAAGAGGGVKQPGAGTILRWRAAPYPFCDLGGGPNRSEWNKLPLHKITGPLQVVGERGAEYTSAAERNFFLVYPGYDVFSEWFAYSRGVAVVNKGSVKRMGYRPLKVQTSLLLNNEVVEPDLMRFSEKLAWRIAGQWSNTSQRENGTVRVPLSPWIKSGDRVQALSPWQSDRTYEYHVLSRQLSWSAATGGSMMLNLERGFDVGKNPNAFADGLARAEVGGAKYSQTFREHDKPGH